jgi:hypothetical protein
LELQGIATLQERNKNTQMGHVNIEKNWATYILPTLKILFLPALVKYLLTQEFLGNYWKRCKNSQKD